VAGKRVNSKVSGDGLFRDSGCQSKQKEKELQTSSFPNGAPSIAVKLGGGEMRGGELGKDVEYGFHKTEAILRWSWPHQDKRREGG